MGTAAMFENQREVASGDRANLVGEDARLNRELQAVALSTDIVFRLKNYNLLFLGLDDAVAQDGDCVCETANIKLILQFIEFRV